MFGRITRKTSRPGGLSVSEMASWRNEASCFQRAFLGHSGWWGVASVPAKLGAGGRRAGRGHGSPSRWQALHPEEESASKSANTCAIGCGAPCFLPLQRAAQDQLFGGCGQACCSASRSVSQPHGVAAALSASQDLTCKWPTRPLRSRARGAGRPELAHLPGRAAFRGRAPRPAPQVSGTFSPRLLSLWGCFIFLAHPGRLLRWTSQLLPGPQGPCGQPGVSCFYLLAHGGGGGPQGWPGGHQGPPGSGRKPPYAEEGGGDVGPVPRTEMRGPFGPVGALRRTAWLGFRPLLARHSFLSPRERGL